MIPLLAKLDWRAPGRRGLSLWLPLFLVWLLLSPLLLILWPLAALGCLIVRVNPLRATGALLGLVAASAGSDVAIEHQGAVLRLHIL